MDTVNIQKCPSVFPASLVCGAAVAWSPSLQACGRWDSIPVKLRRVSVDQKGVHGYPEVIPNIPNSDSNS